MSTTSVSPHALAINGGSPVRSTFLPYGRQSVDEADIQAVVEVLRSDWLTTGPKVGEFEEAFAARVGVAHAVSFTSGTAALHAAAFAAGLKPGDEAEIAVPGADEPVKARVSLVSPAVDPGSTTIEVWFEIAKPNLALRPGVTVAVSAIASSEASATAFSRGLVTSIWLAAPR